MKVVVVESPAKAKTINKYLGSDYKVIASVGHIRDLPAKDGSVDPDNDFAMKWELSGRSNAPVSEISAALKGATKLILATDPDREGGGGDGVAAGERAGGGGVGGGDLAGEAGELTERAHRSVDVRWFPGRRAAIRV